MIETLNQWWTRTDVTATSFHSLKWHTHTHTHRHTHTHTHAHTHTNTHLRRNTCLQPTKDRRWKYGRQTPLPLGCVCVWVYVCSMVYTDYIRPACFEHGEAASTQIQLWCHGHAGQAWLYVLSLSTVLVLHCSPLPRGNMCAPSCVCVCVCYPVITLDSVTHRDTSAALVTDEHLWARRNIQSSLRCGVLVLLEFSITYSRVSHYITHEYFYCDVMVKYQLLG